MHNAIIRIVGKIMVTSLLLSLVLDMLAYLPRTVAHKHVRSTSQFRTTVDNETSNYASRHVPQATTTDSTRELRDQTVTTACCRHYSQSETRQTDMNPADTHQTICERRNKMVRTNMQLMWVSHRSPSLNTTTLNIGALKTSARVKNDSHLI